MKAAALILFGLLAFASGAEERKRYDGYQVLRVQVENEAQADFLSKIEKRNVFDFWTMIRSKGPVDIMANPEAVESLKTLLNENEISFSVMIDDVQTMAEMSPMKAGKPLNKQGHNMDWDDYHPIEDMYGYFDFLEANYDYASTETIGQSFEGTDMRVLKLCTGGCGNKPAMYIDAGIHAREWIGPAVLTFMVRELTENLEDQSLIDQLDWYFLPVHNPDGYKFSQGKDRMWRKTRSYNLGDLCIGTDADRNWDFHYDDGGSADISCKESYHGPHKFSEIENVNVRDFLLARQGDIKFINSMQSYSQKILIPWGYSTEPTPYYDEMFALAKKGNDALYAVYGTEYEFGCIPCVYTLESGLMTDWAHGTLGVNYTYTMELRDTGRYGYLLPADQIIPTGEETWAFQKLAAYDIIAEYA